MSPGDGCYFLTLSWLTCSSQNARVGPVQLHFHSLPAENTGNLIAAAVALICVGSRITEMQAVTDSWQLCAQLKDSVLHCLHPYSLLQIPLEQWSVQHSQWGSASFGALGSISLWGPTCRPAGRRLWAPQTAFIYFCFQHHREKVELILVPDLSTQTKNVVLHLTLGSVVNSPHTDYLKINIRAQLFPKPATVAVLSGLGSPCQMLRAENLGSLQNPFSRSRQVSITWQRMFFVDEWLEIIFF